MAINHIEVLLNVAEVERSLTFYCDLLGLTVEATWADDSGITRWAKLITDNGSALMLNKPSGEPLPGRLDRPAYRDVVVYIHVPSTDDLEAIHGRLSASCAQPGEWHDEMYGQREFIVRDPDGYELAVATPTG